MSLTDSALEPNQPQARLAQYLQQAFLSLHREYVRSRHIDFQVREPKDPIGTTTSRRLTEFRERFLTYAFQHAFGELIDSDRKLALIAIGGTASQTTARHSDLDLMIVSQRDVTTDAEFERAKTAFSDTLLRHQFFCQAQTSDVHVAFNDEVGAGIKNKESRRERERKELETYLSYLPARLVDGHSDTFARFKSNYEHNLKAEQRTLLKLWHDSLSLGWEQNEQPCGTAEFDIKLSEGTLRHIEALSNLRLFIEAVGLPKTLLTSDEAQKISRLREPLLRLKHQMHFLHPEGGRPINPESKELTRCSWDKLRAVAPTPEGRDRFLADISAVRQELSSIAACVHRRVGEYLALERDQENSDAFVERQVEHDDKFAAAYKQLREDKSLDYRQTAEAVVEIFSLWRDKLRPHDPRRVMLNLSSAEHEVLTYLTALSRTFADQKEAIDRTIGTRLRGIFESAGPRAPLLELMARSGWLEVFIPALQAARERMLDKAEYPVLHVRHALDVVRWLDTLLGQFGSVDKGHPYSNLTQQFVQQPDILYLAALLHDVGHIGADAGSSSAHQQRGAEAARKIVKGFGYSDDETYKLAWLVANHHELRRIARLASINDETLGRRVEEAVIGPDSLTMLYALTAADLMSNPRQRTDEAMHSWVARAYKAGSARMSPSDVQHDQENLKHRIAQEYGAQLKYSGSAAMADVENHLQRLPPAYLSELSPEEIVQHLIGISRGAYPYIHWINEETDETDDPTKKRLQRVVVVAHDQAGLLSRMCAGLSFPIVEARVYTRSDGFACNVITCAVPHSWLTSDLVRKSQELRNSLCAESLPSLRFVHHYTAILNREGRQPEQVRYEVLQQILSDVGARLTVKGPDRKHLASLIADIFPGIVTARFASGPPGEVNDSFIVPTPIPKRLLTQLVQRLNREAGILPQESL